jgi:hypothetical protein
VIGPGPNFTRTKVESLRPQIVQCSEILFTIGIAFAFLGGAGRFMIWRCSPSLLCRSHPVGITSTIIVSLMASLCALPAIPMVGAHTAGVIASITDGTQIGTQHATSSIMSSAVESIEQGEGPAGGGSYSCTTSGGDLNCGLRAASSSLPAGAPSSLAPGPSLPIPSPRYGAVFQAWVNRGSTATIVLFGGANAVGQVFDDTWLFTVAGGWVNDTATLSCGTAGHCPSARHDAASAYNPTADAIIVFGGCSGVSPGWTEGSPPCSSSNLLNDTWVWNINATSANWTRERSSGPSPRFGAGMAYNGVTGPGSGEVLFGGCGATCPLNDTWNYTNGNWSECAGRSINCTGPGAPAGRWGGAMAFEAGYEYPTGTAGAVLLFGGCSASAGNCAVSGLLNDTWLFDHGAWHEQIAGSACSAKKPCPSPRFLPSFATWPNPKGSVLLYGGVGASGEAEGDSTERSGGWWFFPTINSTTLAVVPQWGDLTSPPTVTANNSNVWYSTPFALPSPPVARYDGSLTYSTGGDLEMLGFGSSSTGSTLGDEWLDSSTAVGRIYPPIAPPPRFGASMVWDSIDSGLLLFGGCGQACGGNDTWEYRVGAWTPVPTSGAPPPLLNASMVWFAEDTEGVLFGGVYSSGAVSADTWTVANYGGVFTWTKVNFGTHSVPPARQSGSMALYPPGGYAVLFGGCGNPCTSGMDDTWKLFNNGSSGLAWKALSLKHVPDRYGAAMSNNSTSILMFGGCGQSCPLSDTWTFNGNWTQCLTTSCTTTAGPSGRWGAAMASDPTDGYMLMFGGRGTRGTLAETWSFLGDTWTNRTNASVARPPAEWGGSAIWDVFDGAVYLFGGVSPPQLVDRP